MFDFMFIRGRFLFDLEVKFWVVLSLDLEDIASRLVDLEWCNNKLDFDRCSALSYVLFC